MKIEEKQKVFKRLIIVCWIALAFCFIIKLCGGNYFELMSKNESFLNMCNWLDNNYLGTIIMYGFYTFNIYFILSIISGLNFTNKKLLVSIPISILICFIKGLNSSIGYILELALIFVLPMIISQISKKKLVFRIIVSYLLINVFQLISLFIRGLDAQLENSNYYVNILLQVDYYIMLILYYLYSIKMKGETIMGQWGIFWFGTNVAMDKGYTKFLKGMATIGVVLTFPISVPYILWKKHQSNKMIDSKE